MASDSSLVPNNDSRLHSDARESSHTHDTYDAPVESNASSARDVDSGAEHNALDSGASTTASLGRVIASRDASWQGVALSHGEQAIYSDQTDDLDTVISTRSLRGSSHVATTTHESDNDDEEEKLKPGSNFGQFKIVRYIGGGGMGRVYEGIDRDLERKVAIKVLPRRRAQDAATVARFLNEAKSSARLNHENIAQVYLSGNVDGVPYIAFEFVEGTNLRDYVREHGAMELSEAVDYVLQTADALGHAASNGVTHRDVKPSNIIVTPQRRVKLIDMGLARLLRTDVSDDLTESGMTLGTFDYISPEQALDPRTADARSDVYSLGCTFYFMLVGAPPYPEGTMLQKLLQHQGNKTPDVREANPNIPVEIAAVIKKMMEKDPADRYQNAESLIADLLSIADLLGLRLSEHSSYEDRTTASGAKRRSPWRFVPGVCAVLALLACVGYLYSPSNRGDVVLPQITSPVVVIPPSQENTPEETTTGSDTSGSGAQNLAETTGSGAASTTESNGATPYEVGRVYDAEALDAFYARAYGVPVEKNATLPADDARDLVRGYLQDGDSFGTTQRVAFAWRAFAVEPSFETRALDRLQVMSPEDGESLAVSRAYNSYMATPPRPDVPSASGVLQEELRVVDGVGERANSYATLQAALANASSRDSSVALKIELKYNGAVSTPPIEFVDRKVEIFASAGYRPILRFKQPETANGGWGERMFLLNRSELTLRDVIIDFTVPSQDVVASEWSVFESVGASSLAIYNSSLTVCNMNTEDSRVFTAPLHSNVSFFRTSIQTNLMDGMTSYVTQDPRSLDELSEQGFHVRLEKVLARGEASLVSSETYGDRYELVDCGVNVSGAILHFTCDARECHSNVFSLIAEHSLLVGRACLTRIDAEDSTEQNLPFELNLDHSIVCLHDHPLTLVNASWEVDGSALLSNQKLNSLILFDVSALARLRSSRAQIYRDLALEEDSTRYHATRLSDLSVNAYQQIESIPPHLFSIYDFSNCLLNPIFASSSLSTIGREIAEQIRQEFLESFPEQVF
ncbi:MAG: serine/threonine-protein kinase [Planctomycetia bacterium]|nr:serine/threonine-protein kinase [Planctomycetia bacterium]